MFYESLLIYEYQDLLIGRLPLVDFQESYNIS